MAILRTNAGLGEVFIGRPKIVSWERLWAFSGGPFRAVNWPARNIHTDLEYAAACGLPSRVAASATQFQGYVVELMIDLFGVEWLSLGTMDVKFIRTVNRGDTLTSTAVVKSKEANDSATRFTMGVDCRNQLDEAVLVGTATGAVGGKLPVTVDQFTGRVDEAKTMCTQLSGPDSPQMDPLEFPVTPELNQQFLYAEEDFDSRYIEGTGPELPIVHPALVLCWSNDTRSPSYVAPSLSDKKPMWATLHTRDQTFFCNPARVGSRLNVTWTRLGSYEKRGRRYSVSKILVVDEHGTFIVKRLYYTTKASHEYGVKV